ncbi:hypothetical protein [Kitasatospora griseola]|uniref:hypothetical protein n=1 Tax=Kitasatospora griseola TaxID=2064 RepID=UPI003442D99D
MRTALTALAAVLLAAAPLTAVSATADAPTTAPAVPTTPNQGYSVPVGTITDLGVLPMLGGLGNDFAHLLGQ